MRSRLVTVMAVAAVVGIGLAAPAEAQAPSSARSAAIGAPYCGISWGSLEKSGDALGASPVTDVRAGRHDCYDRLVIDVTGSRPGFQVRYVDPLVQDASGRVVPLAGGAALEIVMFAPVFDDSGRAYYHPATADRLVDVTGWTAFRQVSYIGGFEGVLQFGLGVRARLPFRAFTLDGPGDHSRLVIDVAHRW
jgi:hypothetical protein